MAKNYDFSGWATKNDLKCADGRTIRKDAFKDCDGKTVPLVWMHDHNDPDNVLGHAVLENREEGVYTYACFNSTERAKNAKIQVEHGDIVGLSIYANHLKQTSNGDVIHGAIREVSLVLAGANPGAYIDTILTHSDEGTDEEGFIFSGEELSLFHADDEKPEEPKKEEGEEKMANEKTIQDVVDSMTEEQKNVMYFLVGKAVEDAKGESNTEDKEMKHNVFDTEETNSENVLSHDDMIAIVKDAKRCGSMKESFLAHGIDNIEYLFPEDRVVNNTPEWIKRDTGWVTKFMGAVSHSPFSRIKSLFADITEDEARAKGYIKGNMKKEEFFSLIKRASSPTTVYKKQKLDRDDVVDIVDIDVVAWLKGEMRMMLDEELARAMLLGDGRNGASDEKINEQCIRPIMSDDSLFSVKTAVKVASSATEEDKAKALIKAAIKARKNYKGSGKPMMFTTEDNLTEMLLLTDTTGRDLYSDEAALARKLRVSEIVTVEPMENLKDADGHEVAAIIVNPADYRVGADKGGSVNMFDDFDIDYNAQKYLIETRCSGMLTKPYSSLVLHFETL